MSESNIPDKILKQIQALFTLANDGRGNLNEQAAAAAKAQHLLSKYKLEIGEITDSAAAAARFKVIEKDVESKGGKRGTAHWKRILAFHIARANFCDVLVSPIGLKFIGSEEDLPITLWLYEFLNRELLRLATTHWEREKISLQNLRARVGTDEPTSRRAGVTWKNNFLFGALDVLAKRLEDQRKDSEIEAVRDRQDRLRREAEEAYRNGAKAKSLTSYYETWEQSTRHALAPLHQARKRVQDYVKTAYSDAKEPDKVLYTGHQSAQRWGQMAGAKIPLNKPIEAPNREPVPVHMRLKQ